MPRAVGLRSAETRKFRPPPAFPPHGLPPRRLQGDPERLRRLRRACSCTTGPASTAPRGSPRPGASPTGPPSTRAATISTSTRAAIRPRCRPDARQPRTLGGLEHAHAVALVLADAAIGEQQVHVAEHLREREERLRHGDVAPERLRHLVRGARAAPPPGGGSCPPGGDASRSARSISVRWSWTGSPCPGSTSSTSISRVSRSESR